MIKSTYDVSDEVFVVVSAEVDDTPVDTPIEPVSVVVASIEKVEDASVGVVSCAKTCPARASRMVSRWNKLQAMMCCLLVLSLAC